MGLWEMGCGRIAWRGDTGPRSGAVRKEASLVSVPSLGAAPGLRTRQPLINIDALPGFWLLHLNPPVSFTPLATSLPENEQNKLQSLDGTRRMFLGADSFRMFWSSRKFLCRVFGWTTRRNWIPWQHKPVVFRILDGPQFRLGGRLASSVYVRMHARTHAVGASDAKKLSCLCLSLQ